MKAIKYTVNIILPVEETFGESGILNAVNCGIEDSQECSFTNRVVYIADVEKLEGEFQNGVNTDFRGFITKN
jgi:hypothetical protein